MSKINTFRIPIAMKNRLHHSVQNDLSDHVIQFYILIICINGMEWTKLKLCACMYAKGNNIIHDICVHKCNKNIKI